MAKYLVTGGAGFIGSNMVEALVKAGHRVTVLDNCSTGRIENLKPFLKKIRFFRGDIRKTADVRKAVRGMEYVWHAAALRAVLRSVDNPIKTNDVNVGGTLNMLIAAREAGVKRFVFSSSSSVYGDRKDYPFRETDKPQPESPYAATKLMGEYYCRLFYKLYGLETVSLRYFNVFGPRQNVQSKYSLVIPLFLNWLIQDRRPVVEWDGHQSRDFSYVDNVIHASFRATMTRGVGGEVFNVACHEEYSILEILEELKKILHKPKIMPIFKGKRPGDVRRTYADIRKAQKYLRYKVQTRFQPGLKKSTDYFLKSGVLKKVAS